MWPLKEYIYNNSVRRLIIRTNGTNQLKDYDERFINVLTIWTITTNKGSRDMTSTLLHVLTLLMQVLLSPSTFEGSLY